MWKTNTSDVYLATRSLGGALKASLHASGQCHVRAPDPRRWLGDGHPPSFLEKWQIDVASNYQFPFSVIIPEPELRCGEWAAHRPKGTVWLNAPSGTAIQVAIFLVRAVGDLSASLSAAGWSTSIVDTSLPDQRRLLVMAGTATLPSERQADLSTAKASARAAMTRISEHVAHPRMLLLAGPNEHGTRTFVEAAVL